MTGLTGILNFVYSRSIICVQIILKTVVDLLMYELTGDGLDMFLKVLLQTYTYDKYIYHHYGVRSDLGDRKAIGRMEHIMPTDEATLDHPHGQLVYIITTVDFQCSACSPKMTFNDTHKIIQKGISIIKGVFTMYKY